MATSNRKQASSLSAEFQVLIIYAVIFGVSRFRHSGYFLCSFVLSRGLSPVDVLFPQYNQIPGWQRPQLSYFVFLSVNKANASNPSSAIH